MAGAQREYLKHTVEITSRCGGGVSLCGIWKVEKGCMEVIKFIAEKKVYKLIGAVCTS